MRVIFSSLGATTTTKKEEGKLKCVFMKNDKIKRKTNKALTLVVEKFARNPFFTTYDFQYT